MGCGAQVIGVSPDPIEQHVLFRDKYGLNFPLLSDASHAVAQQYGAWREKERDGQVSMGIQRSTFLIDAEGQVARVWRNVNVDGHDEEVLVALREMGGTTVT